MRRARRPFACCPFTPAWLRGPLWVELPRAARLRVPWRLAINLPRLRAPGARAARRAPGHRRHRAAAGALGGRVARSISQGRAASSSRLLGPYGAGPTADDRRQPGGRHQPVPGLSGGDASPPSYPRSGFKPRPRGRTAGPTAGAFLGPAGDASVHRRPGPRGHRRRVGDLGTEQGRRVPRVTRGDGDRRSLPLPGPAAVRIDADLARRPDPPVARVGRDGPSPATSRICCSPPAPAGGCSPPWVTPHAPPRQVGRASGRPDRPGRPGCDAALVRERYLDAGGLLSELQEVMGHADPRTTRRYDRERQPPSRSPGDLLAAYLSTRPAPAVDG